MSTERYLYIWENSLGLTCFGITSRPESRVKRYEGHCGIKVAFRDVWVGPAYLIEDLEDRIKKEFNEHLFSGYEWINPEVGFHHVKNWISWEVENSYNHLIRKSITIDNN